MKFKLFSDIGINAKYAIYEDGRVYSYVSNRFLKHNTNPNGYHFITICTNSKRKNYLVHRLIALAFIPNPDSKPFINHKNCDPKDNSIANLEWCTQSENLQHSHDNGRWSLSEKGRASVSRTHKNKIVSIETRKKQSVSAFARYNRQKNL